MGDPDSRIGSIDVLATCSTCSIGINFQVGGIDIDLDLIFDNRIYEDRSKGGLSLPLGIEGRNSDQPVHPSFTFKKAVGIGTVDLHCHTLDPGFFPGLKIINRDLEPSGICPASIHSHQHLSPVL